MTLSVSDASTRNNALLQVTDLKKYYAIRSGVTRRTKNWVKAVDGISLHVNEGETLGLVGESGCGKTTVGRTILRLVSSTAGRVLFKGIDVFEADGRELQRLRRDMQIIFQNPFSSLNPRIPVGKTITDGLRIHGLATDSERKEIAIDLLCKVGLEASHAKRYPHEFSGGQRQRIGIARALALRPSFILCDEPVSALDVSIQSQVLNLLKDLQEEFNLAYLFIAHDMSVVEHLSNRVAVMYLGKIVEIASKTDLFRNPLHPYTQALMSAIPVPKPHSKRQRIILPGDVPSPKDPPKGCRFHTRCPVAFAQCREQEPRLKEVSPGHKVACWRIE